MKVFYKFCFLFFLLFTFFSLSITYYSLTTYAICTDTDSCDLDPCNSDSHCGPGNCCVPNDPPGGGCSGANSCGASECCVAGACEPKNGASCGGGGSLSCPSGTQPNPISPFPGCTATGNCCCAVAQLCPGNITCGTSVTVPNGQCGLTTCNGPVCPTTPPTGCSSNPSSCGVGRCCTSNVCGNCPSTPPPATTAPIVSGVVINDANNDCAYTFGDIGWFMSDPVYGYSSAVITINGSSTAPVSNFSLSGGMFSRSVTAGPNNTLTLSGLPTGYRCSDCSSATCPTRTGVTSPSSGNLFYITNMAPASTPIPLDSWWQVKDGEATTNGNLTSKLPAGSLFNIVGLGGFHGLPVFGGSLNTGSGTVSTLLWNANTQGSYTRVFDYSYFENLIPDDVVLNDVSTLATGTGATTYSDGYQWYRVNGNYTINSDVNFGTRKVILFVKSGNLTINGKVNLDDNQGFFGTFVNGSISINPALTNTAPNPAIEGIFLSDTTFTTGAGNSLLHLRGSVVSLGNITLGRNLLNNTTNAELFEFAPDLISLFPEKLRFKRTKWTEVAP